MHINFPLHFIYFFFLLFFSLFFLVASVNRVIVCCVSAAVCACLCECGDAVNIYGFQFKSWTMEKKESEAEAAKWKKDSTENKNEKYLEKNEAVVSSTSLYLYYMHSIHHVHVFGRIVYQCFLHVKLK